MRPFLYARVETPADAVRAAAGAVASPAAAGPRFLAGGTTLLDLMKLDVMRPEVLIDINGLERGAVGRIETSDQGLRLGALVRMADAAEHPRLRDEYPMLAQSLQLAASQQLRNMASLAGNVLQRTRCPYFRDTAYTACNKRLPGSGCAALTSFNRQHAVLGTSDACIATYPGDFAQALIALDAKIEVAGPQGMRTVPFATLHRPPGSTPHVETSLYPGELIAFFVVPAGPWTRRSVYLKVRDRQSYEFALTSAAVGLAMNDGVVEEARIALGGVATTPWRARDAEAALNGQRLDETTARAAAEAAFRDAAPREHNAFKVALGKRTLVRALHQAATMEL